MSKLKRVTSSDVAREAGVSRATVSYILNNVQNVSIREETRKKVHETAKKLGYHPDSIARALKTNKSMSIGIVSKRSVSEIRYVKVLDGIKEVMSKYKYSIIICSDNIDDSGYPDYYSYYKSRKIDGVLFLSYHELMEQENIDERVNMALTDKIPIVFADYHLNNPMVNCIDINYYHGAYIATKHLIELGHKNIIYLRPDYNTEQENQRIKGVKKAIGEATDVKLIQHIIPKGNHISNDEMKKVLSMKNKYTAIIAAWNSIAYTVIYEAQKACIRIPEELSIIALAGSNFDLFTYPRLSTCNLPLYELGKKSAEILMNLLEEPKSLPLNVSLPCNLKNRDSC